MPKFSLNTTAPDKILKRFDGSDVEEERAFSVYNRKLLKSTDNG